MMSQEDAPKAGSERRVLFEIRDHVAYVTINQPDRLNAISRSMKHELMQRFVQINNDPGVWAAVIRGAGERAFSVGADIKELNDDPIRVSVMADAERNIYEALLEVYKPTIAAVSGWALGAGCQLALACDLRVATPTARLGLPEAKRGMGANFGSVLLPRLLPRAIALEMVYTGEPIDAETAKHWGLYNRVVPVTDLATEAERLVRRIVANAPLSLRRYKEVATKAWGLPPAIALRLNVGPDTYVSEDRLEGTRAFVEKRPPRWAGR